MQVPGFIKFLPFYLLSYLPLPIMYAISNVVYLVLYKGVGYRKKVVQSNLQRSFPDKSARELAMIEKKFYRYFCDLFLETVKPLAWSKKRILKHLHYTNPEVVQAVFEQNKNVILYTAHYGNWEWMISLPLVVPHKVTTMYRKLKSPYFDDFMNHLRSKYGVSCLEMKTAYKGILQYERKNIRTLIPLVGDQSPDPNSAMHWKTFLNQDTAFFKGAEIIGRKLDAAIIYPSVKRVKRGHYEVTFKVIEGSAKNSPENFVVDTYAKWLEQDIMAQPELWLWTHKRWKRKNKRETAKKNY